MAQQSPTRRRKWGRVAAVMTLPLGLATCKSPAKEAQGAAPVDRDTVCLLYTLASKQKDVDKLLLVKKEQPDVRTVILKIAAAFANAAKQMESLAAADASLQLDAPVLPEAELETRASIEGARARALLFSSGKEFELQLLLSQAEGLSYGTHLAKVASKAAADETQRKLFLHLEGELQGLYEEILALIGARYQFPDELPQEKDKRAPVEAAKGGGAGG